jgi:AcrR family transcriptional regulator
LRAVARELGVTSMAIYTYVDSRDELYRLVVDRLISARLADFVWPQPWAEAMRSFSANLSSLIEEHPALIEAFAEGQMRTAIASSAADHMLQRLLAGGLPLAAAGVAYALMHAVVLGHSVLRQAARTAATTNVTWPAELDHVATPALAAYSTSHGHLVDVPLEAMLDVVIAGIECRLVSE